MADNKYILPDGTPFALWEDETQYTKILHVSQKKGSLDGDGSAEKPFLTIAQAVPLATAGTKVVIHEGIYRETVRPVFGGNSNTEMVMFCGAEGEQVEITGAEIFAGTFRDSEGWKRTEGPERKNEFAQPDAKVYMARFDRNVFIGSNPFEAINGPMIPWYYGKVAKLFHAKNDDTQQVVTMRRGMLFCDGERMEQVLNYFQLGEKDNRFFVEDDGVTFHIRFKDDSAPQDHTLEYTARSYCFCPDERYLGYIHLQNLSFTKGGNGFPPPQRGILSTNRGNHWIIEDCKVLHANGAGADIGFQCPNSYSLQPRGGHLVRRCEFSHCGIVGLTGTTGNSETHYYDSQQESILVEDCRFIDDCWQPFEGLTENASFKMHRLKNSMVINNFFSGAHNGCGIWCDANNENLVVAGNVLLHTKQTYGSIFIEASNDNVHVHHNIAIDSKQNHENGGNGIYSHTCEDIKTFRNICLGCENHGIVHHWHEVQRIDGGSGSTGYGFDTFDNIVADCTHLVMLATIHCQVDRNIYGKHLEQAPLRIVQPRSWLDLKHWQKNLGFDKNAKVADISYCVNADETAMMLTVDGKDYPIDFTADVASQIDGILAAL